MQCLIIDWKKKIILQRKHITEKIIKILELVVKVKVIAFIVERLKDVKGADELRFLLPTSLCNI